MWVSQNWDPCWGRIKNRLTSVEDTLSPLRGLRQAIPPRLAAVTSVPFAVRDKKQAVGSPGNSLVVSLKYPACACLGIGAKRNVSETPNPDCECLPVSIAACLRSVTLV